MYSLSYFYEIWWDVITIIVSNAEVYKYNTNLYII